MKELQIERIAIKIDRSGVDPFADLRLLGTYRSLPKRLEPAAYLSSTIKPNIYGARAAAAWGNPALPNVSGLGTTFLVGGSMRRIVSNLYRSGFSRVPEVLFQTMRIDTLLPGSGIDLGFC